MMRSHVILGIALAALGVTACIIGPKQDDPADKEALEDTGTLADDVGFSSSDTQAADSGIASSTMDTLAPSDAPTTPGGGDAKADGDAGCGDGSVAISGARFNETKNCWGERVFFECQAGPDGGAALTCFAQISTGALYLTGSTQIPGGADFRVCTADERTKTSAAVPCK